MLVSMPTEYDVQLEEKEEQRIKEGIAVLAEILNFMDECECDILYCGYAESPIEISSQWLAETKNKLSDLIADGGPYKMS